MISRKFRISFLIYAVFCAAVSFKFLETVKNSYIKNIEEQRAQAFEEIPIDKPLETSLDTENSFKKLMEYIKSKKGNYSVYIKDINTGEIYSYNSDKEYYAASLYKLPLAAATLKRIEDGAFKWNQVFQYLPSDFSGGTGVINQNAFGTRIDLAEIIDTLIKDSDNVSQNILLRTIPKPYLSDAFNISPQKKYYLDNVATAREVGGYIENLYTGDYLNPDDKAYLLDLLSNTSFDDRISKYLAPGTSFAHKIGSWNSNFHDCGIAFSDGNKYIVCLMSGNTNYNDFLDICGSTANFINKISGKSIASL